MKHAIIFNRFSIVHTYVFRVFRAFRVFRVNLFNYAMPIGRVGTALTGCPPHRSERAQLTHSALHTKIREAKLMSVISPILSSSVPTLMLSLCIAVVSLGLGLYVYRPSLPRHYPVSKVLLRYPTSVSPFGFLRLLRRRPYSHAT